MIKTNALHIVANGGAEFVRQLIIANPAEGDYSFSTWFNNGLASFEFKPEWEGVFLVGFPTSTEENNQAVADAIATAELEFFSNVEGWKAYGATIISVEEIEGHRADLAADANNFRTEFNALTTEAIGNNIADASVKNALVEYFLRGDQDSKAIAEKAQAEYQQKVQATIDAVVEAVFSTENTKGVYSMDLTANRAFGLTTVMPSKIAMKLQEKGARAVILKYFNTDSKETITYVAVNTRIEDAICTDVTDHLGENTEFGGRGREFTVSTKGDKFTLATETLVALA